MGRSDQRIKFGPVAGMDSNVIHLSPAYRGETQNERAALGQLADHTKAIAELMSQLSAEIASCDRQGELLPLVSATARIGQRFSMVGSSLDNWRAQDNSRDHPDSSEKNAL